MIVDLLGICRVNEVKLMFTSTSNTAFLYPYSFKVSLYGHSFSSYEGSYQASSLYNQMYDDNILPLLTDPEIKNKRNVSNQEIRDSISINGLEFEGRYLTIDIKYYKTQKILVSDQALTFPDIIPLVYGIPFKNIDSDPTFEKLFNVDGVNKKDVLTIGQNAYERLESSEMKNVIYIMKGMLDTTEKKKEYQEKDLEKDKEKEERVDKSDFPLNILHDNLRKMIMDLEEKNTTNEIRDIIQKIEKKKCLEDKNKSSKLNLEYLFIIGLEYLKIINNFYRQKDNSIIEVKDIDFVKFSLYIFSIYVVYNNNGNIKTYALNFLKEVIIKNLAYDLWVSFNIITINKFLLTSNFYYSQNKVTESLDYFSVPEGEIISYLLKKLNLREEDYIPKVRKVEDKFKPGNKNTFTLIASCLLLAYKSIKKIEIPSGENFHFVIYCDECENKQRFIEGIRNKCGQCSNINLCNKENCLKNHIAKYPNHCFIVIPSPLPYSPNLDELRNIELHPLLPEFDFDRTSKIHIGIECDKCGQNNIEDIRYLCANCEDFNLCSKCYIEGNHKHPTQHVFIKLSAPLKIDPGKGTPKALIPLLAPELYYIPTMYREKKDITLQRSFSLSTYNKNESEYERLDYDQSIKEIYKLFICVTYSQEYNNNQKNIIIKLLFELFISLSKLCTVSSISSIIKDETSLSNFLFFVLYLNEPNTTALLVLLIDSIINHTNLKVISASKLEKLSSHNRYQYLEKIRQGTNCLYTIAYSLQSMILTLINISENN